MQRLRLFYNRRVFLKASCVMLLLTSACFCKQFIFTYKICYSSLCAVLLTYQSTWHPLSSPLFNWSLPENFTMGHIITGDLKRYWDHPHHSLGLKKYYRDLRP